MKLKLRSNGPLKKLLRSGKTLNVTTPKVRQSKTIKKGTKVDIKHHENSKKVPEIIDEPK